MIFFVVLFTMFMLIVPLVLGQEEEGAQTTQDAAKRDSLSIGLKAIAAAIAVGMCALATGRAQSSIGAAGVGSIAEKPETAGSIIILIAIPETLVILGFVVSAMIILFL